MEVNRQAPGVARDEVFVEASPQRVWALQTDMNSWPSWRSDVSRAELDGDLEVGSVFRWRSGGFGVASTIREVEPERRLVWTGKALGTRAVHAWVFEPREGGVLVRTEEERDETDRHQLNWYIWGIRRTAASDTIPEVQTVTRSPTGEERETA
jgi:uncharacterized protein YndB with AHSA1/START domain